MRRFPPYFHTCRSLCSRSFRGVLLALRLRHPTVCPVTLARGASLPDFSPGAAERVFFVAFRAPVFPRPLYGHIFRNDSRSKHTPVYPTSKLAALSPLPRPPLIISRPLRGRFFPQSKMLVGSKSAREKKILPVKILVFLAVKQIFCP